MIKRSRVKQKIKSKGYRIGNKTLFILNNKIEEQINKILDKTIRSAKLSGRKTIRKEDIPALP